MPLDFPASPTNGQTYGNYLYDSSITAWRNLNTETGVTALNSSGLKIVVPTSVSVSAGSASVNGSGKITFSGCTSIMLDGVFSSTFNNYRILYNITYPYTSTHLYKFRTDGVDNSSANYNWQESYATGTTLGANRLTAQTNGRLGYTNANDTAAMVLDVFNPNISTEKSQIVSLQSASVGQVWMVSSVYNATARFTGISMYAGAGTSSLTGTIQVYGYTS